MRFKRVASNPEPWPPVHRVRVREVDPESVGLGRRRDAPQDEPLPRPRSLARRLVTGLGGGLIFVIGAFAILYFVATGLNGPTPGQQRAVDFRNHVRPQMERLHEMVAGERGAQTVANPTELLAIVDAERRWLDARTDPPCLRESDRTYGSYLDNLREIARPTSPDALAAARRDFQTNYVHLGVEMLDAVRSCGEP